MQSRPLRIPKDVLISKPNPPIACAGEKGSWVLSFILSKPVSSDQVLWLCFHGGRNLKPPWQGFQTDNPSQEGYVSLQTASGELLSAINRSEDNGIFSFRVPLEGFEKGEVLTAHLTGVTAPRLSHPDRFVLLMVASPIEEIKIHGLFGDTLNRIVGACMFPIIGSVPVGIRAIAPSTVPPAEGFSLLVRPEDANRNTACQTPGDIVVHLNGERILTSRFEVDGSNCVRIAASISKEGIYRFEVEDAANGMKSVTNPIICGNAEYKLLWGAFHGHTEISDGVGSLDRYFKYIRDECALDFAASSDHDNEKETPDNLWHLVQKAVARYNEPHRFTVFLGYEWAKWRKLGHGDRNVYYLEDYRPIYRSDEGHYPTPLDLFGALKNESAIIIPHHPPHPGNHNDWTFHESDKERLVEIYSIWGCSERSPEDGNPLPGSPVLREDNTPMNPLGYVQRALALGWRVGFTADFDDHLGHVGDRTTRGRGQTGGLTAVWAKENTRQAIWEALWNRRCYGTTGERIILNFQMNNGFMGSEFLLAEHPNLASSRKILVSVCGTAPIKLIEIVRNNKDIYTSTPGRLDVELEWVDCEPLDDVNLPPTVHLPKPFTFYYVRITQEDGAIAWSSPIWIIS
ncbi:MAG: DUF3604 domain-containing protein [Armatimonadetes bacterium]|nr:DUF3604 domain-containing protein [Armatimonadota bacterium]